MEVKSAEVIMLPTKEKSNIQQNKNKSLSYMEVANTWNPFHLYIVDDSEIQEGDWFINVHPNSNYLDQRAPKRSKRFALNSNALYNNPKKIIATTDELLNKGWIVDVSDSPTSEYISIIKHIGLPKPSKSFIEKYCKLGGINEVNVEYVIDMVLEYSSGTTSSRFLKINSHNEITIHPIKDSWSRNEIETLIKQFSILFVANTDTAYQQKNINEWINKNL